MWTLRESLRHYGRLGCVPLDALGLVEDDTRPIVAAKHVLVCQEGFVARDDDVVQFHHGPAPGAHVHDAAKVARSLADALPHPQLRLPQRGCLLELLHPNALVAPRQHGGSQDERAPPSELRASAPTTAWHATAALRRSSGICSAQQTSAHAHHPSDGLSGLPQAHAVGENASKLGRSARHEPPVAIGLMWTQAPLLRHFAPRWLQHVPQATGDMLV
mmetsp:Transcript_24117/g.67120  ORF Transcript_24117/g.67120 Transcript_24117/m.67120 type:complete len:217 (-) Transcript_24117:1374-2024(-)